MIHVATIVLVTLKLPMMGSARDRFCGDLNRGERRTEKSESEYLAQRSTKQCNNENYYRRCQY